MGRLVEVRRRLQISDRIASNFRLVVTDWERSEGKILIQTLVRYPLLQAIGEVRGWMRHGTQLENRWAPKVRPHVQRGWAHHCGGGQDAASTHPSLGGEWRCVRRHNEVSRGPAMGSVHRRKFTSATMGERGKRFVMQCTSSVHQKSNCDRHHAFSRARGAGQAGREKCHVQRRWRARTHGGRDS
jgi:hypothetical protein